MPLPHPRAIARLVRPSRSMEALRAAVAQARSRESLGSAAISFAASDARQLGQHTECREDRGRPRTSQRVATTAWDPAVEGSDKRPVVREISAPRDGCALRRVRFLQTRGSQAANMRSAYRRERNIQRSSVVPLSLARPRERGWRYRESREGSMTPEGVAHYASRARACWGWEHGI